MASDLTTVSAEFAAWVRGARDEALISEVADGIHGRLCVVAEDCRCAEAARAAYAAIAPRLEAELRASIAAEVEAWDPLIPADPQPWRADLARGIVGRVRRLLADLIRHGDPLGGGGERGE